MGPKKKGGGSGGGGGGGGKTNAPQAYKISRQLDQERIDFLAKRVEELLGSNNELRTSSSRNEKDTHDIVLYFQREMEMKDDIITRLNEELVKRETQLKFEVEKMKKKFDAALQILTSFPERYPDSPLLEDMRRLEQRVLKGQDKLLRDQVVKKWHFWLGRLTRDAARELDYGAAITWVGGTLSEEPRRR